MHQITLDVPGRSRREVLAILACAAATTGSSIAHAQLLPDKPGRIVVAFAPASSTDSFARTLANLFQTRFGQPFIVENRPGAGGWTGTLVVAQSKPDGLTLTVNANGMAILGLVQKNSFDATVDLTPVAMLARSPVALIIPESFPAKTVKEFVAYAKAHSNEILYGSAGVGSINHIYGELFKQRTGIKMTHVPYRGLGTALPDLATSRIHMIFSSYATGAGLINSGKLRLLAYASDTRPEGTPDAPSVRASGFDYEASFWWALFGPGGMTRELTKTFNEATNEAMKDPSFSQIYLTSGVVAAPMGVDEFKAEVKQHYLDLKSVVDTAGIVFE